MMIDKVQLARGAKNSDKQERATKNLPRERRKETPVSWQIFAYLAIEELFLNSNVSSSMISGRFRVRIVHIDSLSVSWF